MKKIASLALVVTTIYFIGSACTDKSNIIETEKTTFDISDKQVVTEKNKINEEIKEPTYVTLPYDKEILLFVGQDLGSVGGLQNYNNGYLDFFSMSDGVTSYTNLPGLNGLTKLANWNAGDVNAKLYIDNSNFNNCDLAIGLYMVNHLKQIYNGVYDVKLDMFADFIKNSNRTVYLRIGYEFDGSWNHYNPDDYINAYKYIVDYFNNEQVTNCRYVWQSYGGSKSAETLLSWYPGDEYVDWLGYSYFNGNPNIMGQGILELARQKDKPVFICESTPKKDVKSEDPYFLVDSWYTPFLNHIKDNSDVIKAISYINCDWDSQALWKNKGWGDSRLQISNELTQWWNKELEIFFHKEA